MKLNYCPECRKTLSSDLQENISNGIAVYCENCGFRIDPRPELGHNSAESSINQSQKKLKNRTKHKEYLNISSSLNKPKDNMNKIEKWIDILNNWFEEFIENVKKWWHELKLSFSSSKNKNTMNSDLQMTGQVLPYKISSESKSNSEPYNFSHNPSSLDLSYGKSSSNSSNSQNSFQNTLNNIPKYNPYTGEPNQEALKLQKTEFNILDSEIRQRFMQIPMSKHDQDVILESFVYLDKSKQQIYIEELEKINLPIEKRNPRAIHIIKALPIPQNQIEQLIKQLDFLKDEEHESFVNALTPKSKNSAGSKRSVIKD